MKQAMKNMRFVDLTAELYEEMAFNHPNHPRAPLIWQYQRHEFSQWLFAGRWDPPRTPRLFGLPPEAGEPGRGHGVQSEQVLIGTHMGTHLDSPLHFDHHSSEDIARIDLERCWGEALMLDLRNVCGEGRPISQEDLNQAEAATGDRVHDGDIVILHTGHSARYGYGPNADQRKWAQQMAGIDHDAPEWFLKRRVKLIGIDSPSVDCDLIATGHINFLLRKWVGEETILIVENLVHLEDIPCNRFIFMALPLPFRGGSASPVRAVAIV
jgi:kynurenine formamidase